MRTIKIMSLALKNFKGIKELTVPFNGQNVNISGDNATGKTSLVDAFMWLLFDKDSQNRKDFEIKTLDKNGEAFHGLDHSAKGTLEIDGKEVVIQKIYKEKWVKNKGEAERQFSGNTTDYYIDEVPVKKSEYDVFIKNIMDENLFKLITNVLYFNEQLKWQERREILLAICGDIDDLTVIESNSKIKALAELLSDNTVEELRAKIRGRKKLLNDDLKGIPVRIDEIVKGMPEITENDEILAHEMGKVELLSDINFVDSQIKEIDTKILELGNIQKNWDGKNILLSKKKSELSSLKLKIEQDAAQKANRLKIKLNNLRDDISEHSNLINRYKKQIEQSTESIEQINKELAKLRERYQEISLETFKAGDIEQSCPTCHQLLPEGDLAQMVAKMRDAFDSNKAKQLSSINTSGKSKAADKNDLTNTLAKLTAKVIEKEKAIDEVNAQIVETEEQLADELANTSTDLSNWITSEYKDLENEIVALTNELNNPDDDQAQEKEKLLAEKQRINDERRSMQEKVAEIDKLLAASEQIKKSNARIDELKAQERTLAAEIAKLEGQEFMTEEFIKSKVSMLEERINSKFKFVNFKMFNMQVNGALEETCEALVKGVPFSNANNAAKINAGIDIINSLTEHYQITAPIWIDNAESVNKLIDSNSQLIRLVVSKDEKLVIENGGI